MNDLRTAAQQALAFTMRDFASLRDFEAAKAVLHDNLRTALAQQDEPAQKQDAELSAALGWPGGISNPVLDRKVLLQKVAALRLASQQALEAWDGDEIEWFKRGFTVMENLRAALAQQDEPVAGCETEADCTSQPWCRIRGECQRKQAEPVQDEPVHDRHGACPTHCCPIHGCKYMHDDCPVVSGAVKPVYPRNNGCESCAEDALAQQAEPVEPGAWVASKDGRVIYDDASTDDGLLRVSGDFKNDEQRVRYAQRIVDKLNAALAQQAEPVEPVAWNWMLDGLPYGQAYYGNPPDTDIAERAAIAGRTVRLLYTAPPQRKPLPKHDQHCVDVPGYGLMAVRLVRAVERAHGIKE